MKYTNPIIKGFHPDPSICFDGQTYYLVCSSFEFFPSLPIFASQDLLNWEFKQYAINQSDKINLQGIKNSMGLFAPTIRFFNGTYFLVCTNITQGNFVCHTKDIANGWSDPIWIDCPMGIDPSLSFFENRFYYQLTTFNQKKNSIIQFEINPYNGEMLSQPIEISQGCGGRDVEAPHLFKKDDWYYLVLAEGGTREGHMITIQRSKNINGPFEGFDGNPILTNREIKSPLQATGHGDFFQDKVGNWWVVALATRPKRHFTLLGRETILLPVEWIDDWPVINETGHAAIEIDTNRFSETSIQRGLSVDFLSPKLQSLRFPITYSYDTNLIIDNLPNHLGNLSDEPNAFLSLSQSDFAFCFESELVIDNCEEGLFGIAIYKDDTHFCKFGLNKMGEHTNLFSYKQIYDLKIHQDTLVKNTKQIKLRLTGEETCYRLLILDELGVVLFEDEVATRHFTNECSESKFTGVQIGIFAEAKTGQTCFITPKMIC
ncbi:MAG: glycoside hydrolase family 43 protein [Enterococcus lemanii]|jgi:xylan 1,4-beta-xylosidase